MRRRIVAVTAMFLCVCSLLICLNKSTVYAESVSIENSFQGDVELLKQDGDNYVMQVTVENSGKDFTGTVQVVFAGSIAANCAYNTEITLPSQSKKQFTITIPDRAVDTANGLCAVNFLDKKGNLVQSIPLKNVFGSILSGIPVGILSDHFPGLTYMDAGGQNFDIQNRSQPLKLIELSENNLHAYLDGLYFLVIDQFNMSSLSEESILEIQEWVKDGGWLLIGTGAYAQQTLSGFEEDFLDISVISISEPGEENTASANADRYGYYSNYDYADIDFTGLSVAELDYYQSGAYYYESTDHPAICSSLGDGAVLIYLLSFGEPELQKLDDYMIRGIYEEVMYQSSSYHSYYGYSDLEYAGQRLMALIDSLNTDVDFSFLKVLMGIYVVLVGPVLYLILRKCKKNEWYWIGVPVLGLTFIAAVFLLGHGARVNETRVYSVTAQRADSNHEETYFLAYHSGVKEWNIQLNESYETAGPGWTGYGYYWGGKNDLTDYYYAVKNGSKGLTVGIKPNENFESGYLYAEGKAEVKGNISSTDLSTGLYSDFEGTVTNDTAFDMAYMAVWDNDYIMVFSDVKMGETIDLQQAVADGRCVYQSTADTCDDMMYNLVSIYGYSSYMDYEQDDMAALVIGLGIAEEARPADRDYAIIAGVVRDYEKSVAGKCNETSYGCLYSYAEMEVR